MGNGAFVNNLNAITEQEIFEAARKNFEAVYKDNAQRFSKEECRWIREHIEPKEIYEETIDKEGNTSPRISFQFTEDPAKHLSLSVTRDRLWEALCGKKDPDEDSYGIQEIWTMKREFRKEGTDMARNKVVTLRMTEEEKDRLEALAGRFGQSLTSMVTMLINKAYYDEFEQSIDLAEGINELDDMDVIVENGVVIRGVRRGVTVHPFEQNGNEYVRRYDLSVSEYRKLLKRGLIKWA